MTEPHPLDDVVNSMFWPAVHLVGAVRARDPGWVASIVTPLTHEQTMALLVAVAALVPDDQDANQLALWTHGPAVRDQVYGQLVITELRGRHKKCSGCGRRKPLSDFYPSARSRDGVESRCRVCRADGRRQQRRTGRDTNPPQTTSRLPEVQEVAV